MSRLRILHLTDLHLRDALPGTADRAERRSREMPAVLEKLSRQLAGWTPDLIAITGDLLDVPDDVVDGSRGKRDPSGYEEAVEQSAADYRLMRDWLDGTGVATAVIPGNHDHRGAFEAVFGTHRPDLECDGWRILGFDDDLDDRRAPLRPAEERARFDAALAAGEPAASQVHLQHYLLAPRIFRRSDYTYADDLRPRIDASRRVACVLSGHYHPGALAHGATGVLYSTPPAFGEAPFRFRLVDLHPERDPVVTDAAVT